MVVLIVIIIFRVRGSMGFGFKKGIKWKNLRKFGYLRNLRYNYGIK